MEESMRMLPEDFYVGILADAAKRGLYPPSLQISPASFKCGDKVFLYASVIKYNGKVTRVSFFCTNHKVKNAEFFGEMDFKEYLELEDTIDAAVSDYRRTAFKKISHRQRHRGEMV